MCRVWAEKFLCIRGLGFMGYEVDILSFFRDLGRLEVRNMIFTLFSPSHGTQTNLVKPLS